MHSKPSPPSLFTQVAAYCAIPLIVVSVLVVLIATLYPFSMKPVEITSPGVLLGIVQRFLFRPSGAEDWQDNLLLFIPLGFGLASATVIRRFRAWWLLAVLACTGLSLTVECLQVLLPSRAPTAIDVFTNTIGGGLGIAAFILLQGLCTTRRRFAIITMIAASFLLLLTIPLQHAARFSNWEYSHSLSVGNSLIEDDQWDGTIYTLALSAVAASPDQLMLLTTDTHADATLPWLVRYDFTAPNPLADQTGQRQSLTPKQSTQLPRSADGVTLSHGQTLVLPPDEVMPITAAIQRAVGMTALLIVTPQRQGQQGLITSIANKDGQLNLMIRQDTKNLIIQLRTPVTGEQDGSMMMLVVSDVFTGDQPHAIAMSYTRGLLRVAVDGQMRPETLQVTPALAFFSLMLPFKANNVLARYNWILSVYAILYAGLVFVPVGLTLALWMRPTWTMVWRSIAALGGAALAMIAYAGLAVLAGGLWSSPSLMTLQIVVVITAWALFWQMISRVANTR